MGGWSVGKDYITSGSIVYSFGIGYDISFEKALLDRFNCKVFAYDPTDKVIEWLIQQSLPNNFLYEQIAISDKDEKLKFFTVPEGYHFNFDQDLNTHGHSSTKSSLLSVEVEGRRLKTLMKNNNHSKIDLLKLDIEGAEYDVVDDIINSQIKPTQILIEFHHYGKGRKGVARSVDSIRKIKDFGYKLFAISTLGTEYSFIKNNEIPSGN